MTERLLSYLNKEKQLEYQNNWLKQRREEWLREHGPCVECGSFQNLDVDHIFPEQKVSHNVWSWTKERRDEELKKCQVLCSYCHQVKTTFQMKRKVIEHGTYSKYHRGCRCNICKEVGHIYNLNYHLTHPRSKKHGAMAESD